VQHKDSFFFDEFVKQWSLSKSLEKFTQFLAFLSHKYNLPLEDLTKDLQDFSEEEKDNLFKDSLTLNDEYKTFLDSNESKLQELYDKENGHTTSVRGIKVRGSFPTLAEAELRAKSLRAIDRSHDIMVGPVGLWLPFDPEAYKTGRTEYLESELNQLMHEKKKNEETATAEFTKRVKEAKERAMKDNIEKAKKSGNKLTQAIDKSGNLVSVGDVTSFGVGLEEGDDTNPAAVRDNLFNAPNVVPQKQVIDISSEEGGEAPSQENEDCEKDVEANESSPESEKTE
jgi:hypothetical protein